MLSFRKKRYFEFLGILSLCLFLIVSCKNTQKEIPIKEKSGVDVLLLSDEALKENVFYQIRWNMVILQNDKFHVFYQTYEEPFYSDDKVIASEIKGSEALQTVIFDLPEGVIPIKLRFDFGMNYHQEPIKFNNISIRYQDKEYTLDFYEFIQLFRSNKYLNWDEDNSSIITQPIEGKYDPNVVSISIEEIVFELMDF